MVAAPDDHDVVSRIRAIQRRREGRGAPDSMNSSVDLSTAGTWSRALHFLRWFSSQDRIMDLGTRERLWYAWGMCDEHSLAWLAIEHSLEAGWLHGPAILYEDLIDKAVWAVRSRLFSFPPTVGMLRTSNTCLVCDQAGRPDRVPDGDPLDGLREDVLRHLTSGAAGADLDRVACGTCAGTLSVLRCRPHLVAELERDRRFDLTPQRAYLAEVLGGLARYSRSFGWANRGADTPADRAALVAGVGWCSGWTTLLAVCS